MIDAEFAGLVEKLITDKDQAYKERNKMLAVLCHVLLQQGCCIGLGKHEGENWDDNWLNVVFIELPTGQVSWHIHDSEMPMFDFLSEHDFKWDGHTTDEKWERLFKCVSE